MLESSVRGRSHSILCSREGSKRRKREGGGEEKGEEEGGKKKRYRDINRKKGIFSL